MLGISPTLQETWLTHRFSYTVFRGSIPVAYTGGRSLDQRACCNPDHLEPVTNLENALRSPAHMITISRTRTHCFRGHEMTADNIYNRPDRPFGSRACRKCRNLANHRRAG